MKRWWCRHPLQGAPLPARLPETGNRAEATPLALRLALGFSLGGMALLALMLGAFALPTLAPSAEQAGGPFTWVWAPAQGAFGILPMLAGSCLLGLFALLTGWPLALGVVCWLLGEGPFPVLHALVRGLVRFMTAIPTVVYGFAAVFLLTPLVRQGLGGSGFSWLSAGVMLALLALPTMVLVLEAGLRPRLEALELQGAALGFTRPALLVLLVLPEARNTLVSAAVLGFGRAVGDTLLPLMLAGNAPQIPVGLESGLRSLTAHMALVTANEVGGAAYNSLFMAGLLLLGINAVVSLALRRLEGRE